MIRELASNELLAVSGGRQVCSCEVANRCYVWREQNSIEEIVDMVNSILNK